MMRHVTTAPRSYLEDCFSRKLIFFTGKGGVGKSTLAWATAVACARAGKKVTVATWNPFEEVQAPSFASSLGIRWVPLETLAAFREYVLLMVKFERIYDAVFENKVLKTFVMWAPGLSETVVAGKIWDLVDKKQQDIVIVDLPASGHAISFFSSPLGIRQIFPVGFVHNESGKIVNLLGSDDCRIDLVALPEELPLVESLQLKQKLETLHAFHFGFLHINQCTPAFALPPPERAAALPGELEAIVERYRERYRREEEAIGISWDMHLRTLKLARYATDSLERIIHQVAEALEKA